MATYPDGVDFSTFGDDGAPDLDPDWRPISGARSVIERVARRWILHKGEMHDPEIGYPLAVYYNASMLPVETAALQAGLRAEALRVEGLDDISVIVTKTDAGVVMIQGIVTLDEDSSTWQFVFQLGSASLRLITLLQIDG